MSKGEASIGRRCGFLNACWPFLALLLFCPPRGDAAAQDGRPPPLAREGTRVDTTRVPVDGAPARALSGLSAVDARAWEGDRTVPLVLPVATRAHDPAHALAQLAGSFLYDFGVPGWPHGWSPDGLSPHQISLSMNGLSYDDPVTGAPRLDLVPLAFVRPLVLGGSPLGAPLHVDTELRTFGTDRPLTELRYLRGPVGLQSIEAVHVQNRSARPFGREGRLQVLGAYAGRAADGEYPGSRLRRGRHVLARVRLSAAGWAFALHNHHTRHRIGAHAGVLPLPGQPFESIYERLGANVINLGARRRTVHNDLVARVEAPILSRSGPTLFQAYWSARTFDYVNQPDTVSVRTARLGILLEQPLRFGRLNPSFQAHIWRDRHTFNWSDSSDAGVQVHVLGRDTLETGALRFIAMAGLHGRGRLSPSASLAIDARVGRFDVFVYASRGTEEASLVARRGFGSFVEPQEEAGPSHTLLIRGGIRGRWGILDASLTGFVHRTEDALEVLALNDDSARAVFVPGTAGFRGLTFDAGWRRNTRRGLYASIQPTLLISTPEPQPFDRDAVLPRIFGRGRIGARILLFRGDLDIDAFVEARAWSEMRSRTLQPATGLLVLPRAGDPSIPASSALGVYVEAGLREATIFLAYENALAGTGLLAGNMNVPVYPLPEQAFRFGVYWPIWD